MSDISSFCFNTIVDFLLLCLGGNVQNGSRLLFQHHFNAMINFLLFILVARHSCHKCCQIVAEPTCILQTVLTSVTHANMSQKTTS